MKERKFSKGATVYSFPYLVSSLEKGRWFYWADKPKHPSIFMHMQLGVLLDGVKRGIICEAEVRDEVST